MESFPSLQPVSPSNVANYYYMTQTSRAAAPKGVSALIAIANNDGSEAAWNVLKDHHIKVEDVFSCLGETDSSRQLLRQTLIDALKPSAPGKHELSVLNTQRKTVNDWLAS